MLISASVHMGGNSIGPNRGLRPITGTHEWALQLPSDVSGGGRGVLGAAQLCTGEQKLRADSMGGFQGQTPWVPMHHLLIVCSQESHFSSQSLSLFIW